jgi:hypothetical protein
MVEVGWSDVFLKLYGNLGKDHQIETEHYTTVANPPYFDPDIHQAWGTQTEKTNRNLTEFPVDDNWIDGYAFDITNGETVVVQSGNRPKKFARIVANTQEVSLENIEAGGKLPTYFVAFDGSSRQQSTGYRQRRKLARRMIDEMVKRETVPIDLHDSVLAKREEEYAKEYKERDMKAIKEVYDGLLGVGLDYQTNETLEQNRARLEKARKGRQEKEELEEREAFAATKKEILRMRESNEDGYVVDQLEPQVGVESTGRVRVDDDAYQRNMGEEYASHEEARVASDTIGQNPTVKDPNHGRSYPGKKSKLDADSPAETEWMDEARDNVRHTGVGWLKKGPSLSKDGHIPTVPARNIGEHDRMLRDLIKENQNGDDIVKKIENAEEQIGLIMNYICTRLLTAQNNEEKDGWKGWTLNNYNVETRFHDNRHFAIALWIYGLKDNGKLDNELLRNIHKILLDADWDPVWVDTKEKKWGWKPRDVLIVVEILRLLCWERDGGYDNTNSDWFGWTTP